VREQFQNAREVPKAGAILHVVLFAQISWLKAFYAEEQERGQARLPDLELINVESLAFVAGLQFLN
jgi:hypothetical protein